MAQLLYTIEEYIAEHRKNDSVWMVFNTRYNELHALHIKPQEDEFGICRFYDETFTDNEARQLFLDYMKEQFPQVPLVKVFDLVGLGWIEWPYLGSIAIDADIGSDVYNALCEKYGDAYEDPISTNQVLWVMKYKDALSLHEKRLNALDDEFGDDE